MTGFRSYEAYKGSYNNGAFKAQGIQLTTKLSYPVMDDLDVYTRLGGMVWRADSTATINATSAGTQNVSLKMILAFLQYSH